MDIEHKNKISLKYLERKGFMSNFDIITLLKADDVPICTSNVAWTMYKK